MIAKIDKTPQLNMYQVPLKQFIKEDHELVILSLKIDWDYREVQEDRRGWRDNFALKLPGSFETTYYRSAFQGSSQ